MSNLTDRLRDGKTVPLMEERRKAADEIDKLRKEIALADSMYKLVVLERDAAREHLDAAQRREEKLHERLTLAESVRAAQVAGLVEGAEKLRDALRGVLPWVVTQVVACNGLKCREDVCMSCNSDAEDNAQLACNAYAVADAALKGEA